MGPNEIWGLFWSGFAKSCSSHLNQWCPGFDFWLSRACATLNPKTQRRVWSQTKIHFLNNMQKLTFALTPKQYFLYPTMCLIEAIIVVCGIGVRVTPYKELPFLLADSLKAAKKKVFCYVRRAFRSYSSTERQQVAFLALMGNASHIHIHISLMAQTYCWYTQVLDKLTV